RDSAAAGAISVSGLKSGRDEADLHRLGAIVSAHAARLSQDLGASVVPLSRGLAESRF
ncbi:MAG: hypothetical protein IT518_04485, partial [Burkholderiales bacterium]|nr:hypothetical protein [Burkholderiales bacterium]